MKDGAAGAHSLEELVQRCRSPRAICLMVPAGVVESALASLAPLLSANDIVIDGGNSHYHDDIERARVADRFRNPLHRHGNVAAACGGSSAATA